jgi:hypothetical protein
MHKKYLHHLWTKLRRVKVWYLVLAFLLTATVAVLALRHNNLRMVELRQAVYTADEKGGDVEGALQALRKYVYAHMNTDLTGGQTGIYPPIQLKYTYQRLQKAEKDRVQQNSSQVYTDAQNECERQNPTGFSGRGRVPCIEAYVASHTATEKAVPDALYKFNFTSPSWSPDLAGFSMILAILLLVVLIGRITVGRILKKLAE